MLLDTHKSEIEALLGRYASTRSAVLPLLYIAQDTYGHLTTEAIREVATILDLPYTDVHEVVGFYTLFYNKPMGAWVLQVCDDVPCCYLGAEELITALKDALGIVEEQTTGDGVFTLQRVKCLAACNRAPVLQANLDYVYEVTPARVGALLDSLRSRVAEARQRGVSGRFAEDYAFAADGALTHLGRPAGIVAEEVAPVAEETAPAAEETAPAAEETALAEEAHAQAEQASPTQLAPDGSPAGEMPKPETAAGGDAIPAHAAQQEPPAEPSEETPARAGERSPL
ncbi:NAD(P)H-dependent oxidoreductase subunit E [Oscillochloris sp. ZM17-4]|uniref:complex I 24 kDa subunit family protein n=1 Tax=Oscillochloris sp. ZM17-4 TaxID=2866714 RepID=UPI002104B64A|nr:NADH-quinone oxidoreductase subunit NuoE [Oscillochloris sp. ZM17-4]